MLMMMLHTDLSSFTVLLHISLLLCFLHGGLCVIKFKKSKYCCLPTKLFATWTDATTGDEASFLIDFEKARMAKTWSDPSHAVRNIVTDFAAGVSYVRYRNGQCRKKVIPQSSKWERCVPKDAQTISHGYMGPDHYVDTLTFRYTINQAIVELTATQGPYNCLPVTRRVFLDKNRNTKEATIFSNVKIVTGNTDQWLMKDFSNCR